MSQWSVYYSWSSHNIKNVIVKTKRPLFWNKTTNKTTIYNKMSFLFELQIFDLSLRCCNLPFSFNLSCYCWQVLHFNSGSGGKKVPFSLTAYQGIVGMEMTAHVHVLTEPKHTHTHTVKERKRPSFIGFYRVAFKCCYFEAFEFRVTSLHLA